MRDIKFRAWDGIRMTTSGIQFSATTGLLTMIKDMPLMQYTGLLDKNGKEIYEGDILSNKDTDGNMVVNWCPISAGFCLDKKGWMFSHYFKEAVDANQCEVIGNIYEDLELLKG